MATKRVCNKCGKELIDDTSKFHLGYAFGCDSDFDFEKLDLDLCPECLDSITKYLIKICKINPILER